MILVLIGCDVENTVSPIESLPTAIITYPANWSTITEEELTITFEVFAVNLDSVEVYLNGQKFETFYQAPFELDMELSDFTEGMFTSYCKVYDHKGNSATSDLINFYWETEQQPESEISINILRPIFWEVFEDSQIETLLNIESTFGVENIDIYIDGALNHTIESEPFSATIEVDHPGEHNFLAIVTDSLGNQRSSELINFSILLPDTEAPIGYITNPANWSNQNGNMQIRISAIDNESVSRIEVLIDGEFYAEIASQPFNLNIDTNIFENGNHTLLAIIYDSSNNFSYSQLTNFEVNN